MKDISVKEKLQSRKDASYKSIYFLSAQCLNNSCSDRELCIEQVNNFTCVCKPGFSGSRCEKGQNKQYFNKYKVVKYLANEI